MKRVPLGLVLCLSAAPLAAQTANWNPLQFPGLPPPAQGTSPVGPVYPHPGASPTYPHGATYPVPGASSTSPASPVYPASPASPVSPVYPHSPGVAGTQGVGTSSTGGTGTSVASTTSAAATQDTTSPPKRLVFKRVRPAARFGIGLGANGFEIYTGEGEDAQLADWVVKSPISMQFNVKENPSKENRAFYLKRRNNWEYTTLTGSYELVSTKCLELRPKDTGFEAFNRSGQKFAAIRWGSYAPDPAKPNQKITERVYTVDSRIVGSLVAARLNGGPALVLRKGSGAAAVPAWGIVFQDWAQAPLTRPGAGEPGFDDLAGGGAPAAAAEGDEDHLTGVAMFLDAWILSKAWRDGVGISHNIQE